MTHDEAVMIKLIDGKLYKELTDYFHVIHATPADIIYGDDDYLLVEDKVFLKVSSKKRIFSGHTVRVNGGMECYNRKIRRLSRYMATNGKNYELVEILEMNNEVEFAGGRYFFCSSYHVYSAHQLELDDIHFVGNYALYNGACYEAC